MSGFTFPPEKMYMSFPNNTPAAVPTQKAINPRAIMLRVFVFKKVSAFAVAPTVVPKNMVTILTISFCAVLESLSVRRDSLNRFPSINMPTRDAADGSNRDTTTVTIIGKITFSLLLTVLSCPMITSLSF